MTDREIIDLLYADRNKGLSALVDTYGTVIYQLVSDILRDGYDDEIFECICDSLEAFYNNLDDVDLTRGSVRGYLGVIAYRRAVNLYCTLNPDDDSVFREYTVEEMSEALKNADPGFMPEVPHRIKLDCQIDDFTEDENIPEMPEDTAYEVPEETSQEAPEENYETFPEEESDSTPTVETVRRPRRVNRIFKIIPMAIALVLIITVGVIAADRLSHRNQGHTTTVPTTTEKPSDPLLSAILSGNDKLIESLITNSLMLTEDIAEFAVQNAGKLSYETVRRIAEAVNERYGTTGLDALLEGAILGDSQKVMDELEGKDKMEMTPSERLAFFFSGAFGNSRVIEEFIEKGFDTAIKDSSGKTIFDIAGIYGNDDILNWRSKQ